MNQEPILQRAGERAELSAERLRWRCDRACFDFTTTDDLAEIDEIIGQDRAVRALRQGLDMDSPGYNIFVAGLAGTGKTTTVRRILKEVDRSQVTPTDKCLVNDFKDPDRPILLTFPSGMGRRFRGDMARLVESLKRDIPKIFESKGFEERQQNLLGEVAAQERRLAAELEKAVSEAGFGLVQVEVGPVTRPEVVYLHEGKPVALDSIKEKTPALSDEKLAALRETYSELTARLQQTMKQTRQLARDAKSSLDELRRNFAADLIELHLSELRERYTDDKVQRYFDEVVTHLLDTLAVFAEAGEADADAFRVYGVNLLVDHADTQGAPIVFEPAPNLRSLFGTIERPSESSAQAAPDFMNVKSGSILEADGGYLLFNIGDAAHDTEVWPTLKRTLKNATLTIQAHETALTVAGVSLKPEPIPIKVKVIVVGDLEIYHLLYELDEDFRKIFKVKSEFDSVMKRSEEALTQMAHFIRGRCREEGLLPFDRSGVATVIEEAVRLTGRRDKISTRFSEVADVVREACYWAKKTAAGVVCGEHVDRALRERRTRLNLIEEKYQEAYVDGTLLIDADGERVGTVNGLTYLDGGDYGFGHPVRITAITSMGRAGIINIEREVELSGKAHSKGVLILEGFLRSRYAQDKPLSMSASIAFEQSYSNVDGDSASSTEVYALISSLSGIPIRQGLGVTGSVNQHGEIQPIGSVNEKIEAFFDLCKKRGLTGRQGVLIPKLNETDLMLSKEVVEHVRADRFHIYPIDTIDEGLEILTGVRAGGRGPDGLYEEGTINRLVDDRLIELAEGLREFGEQPDGDEGDHDGD